MNAAVMKIGDTPTAQNTNSIGQILISNGLLKTADVEKILLQQKKNNVKFGQAAIELKLVSQDDIDFALSKQFDYAYLSTKDRKLSPSLIAAYNPFSPVGENLRAVRSQLMLRWFNGDPSRKVLSVVSAGSGDGKSFIAANLAIVFAQQGERTLLIDADLRTKHDTGQQAQFKLGLSEGLSGILAGRSTIDVAIQVPGLPNLSVIAAGARPPNPQELLGRPAFGELLAAAAAQFDVVIVDTPNGGDFADAEVIAARAGAALMVARVNKSIAPMAMKLARRLQDGGVTLVGSVFNDA